VAAHQGRIAFVAQLLGIGWFFPDQTQSRDTPSLLVYRDDRLDLGQIAQIIDELTELNGRKILRPNKMNPPGCTRRSIAAVSTSNSVPGTPTKRSCPTSFDMRVQKPDPPLGVDAKSL
jgi:hypothetical protein